MTTKKPNPSFIPSTYRVSTGADPATVMLEIIGQRFGPPNKKFTFNQKGLKLKNAHVIYLQKNKQVDYEVLRINHLPSFEQVRLHTANPLYPGNYRITLEYGPVDLDKLKQLVGSDISSATLRGLLPSMDTADARAAAGIEIVS